MSWDETDRILRRLVRLKKCHIIAKQPFPSSTNMCGGGLFGWLETYPQNEKIGVELWVERMPDRQVISKCIYRWTPENLDSGELRRI